MKIVATIFVARGCDQTMIRKRLTVAEAGSNVWEVFDRGKQRNGKHIVESFLNRSDGKMEN